MTRTLSSGRRAPGGSRTLRTVRMRNTRCVSCESTSVLIARPLSTTTTSVGSAAMRMSSLSWRRLRGSTGRPRLARPITFSHDEVARVLADYRHHLSDRQHEVSVDQRAAQRGNPWKASTQTVNPAQKELADRLVASTRFERESLWNNQRGAKVLMTPAKALMRPPRGLLSAAPARVALLQAIVQT